jgi:hypothetical protein
MKKIVKKKILIHSLDYCSAAVKLILRHLTMIYSLMVLLNYLIWILMNFLKECFPFLQYLSFWKEHFPFLQPLNFLNLYFV